MSEEIRFEKNKKVVALSISLVVMIVLAGVFGVLYILTVGKNEELTGDYDELHIDYLELSIKFNSLNDDYSILTGEYVELENDYTALVNERNILQDSYDNLIENFNKLTIDYNNLNNTFMELEKVYNILLNSYDIVLNEYITLNNSYNTLLTDFNTLLDDYNILSNDFDLLQQKYDGLLDDYNTLLGDYDNLLNDYNTLQDSYDALEIQFKALQIAYDYITDTIRQSILPIQYSIFAEAVRRYYMPIYIGELSGKEGHMGYARFCRDMVLHDSGQYNAFSEVSNAFSEALIFGNDTMYLAWYIMYWTFYPWNPYWDMDLTFDELWGIDTIVDWCIDEIDYEYDFSITDGQEYFNWDYFKFPVETAFRTKGDCDDQAILCATYLESCGFETVITLSHDPNHPTLGAFYHVSLLVHIEDTDAFWNLYTGESLWSFTSDPYPPFTWSWLDTTWDVPLGSTPPWLQDYKDFGGITDETMTLVVCDIDGAIE